MELDPAHDQRLVVLAGQLVEVPAFQVDALGAEGGNQALQAFQHVGADGDRGAGLVFQVAGGRQVSGVDAGLEDPGRTQVLLANVGDDAVDEGGRGLARGRVEIEHRIDDGAQQSGRIGHEIGHPPRGGMVIRSDVRLHAYA